MRLEDYPALNTPTQLAMYASPLNMQRLKVKACTNAVVVPWFLSAAIFSA